MVCPVEKVTLWVVHGLPYRECYSTGGPWYALQRMLLYGWSMVCPIEEVTLQVVRGVPYKESYSTGGPRYAL